MKHKVFVWTKIYFVKGKNVLNVLVWAVAKWITVVRQ